MKFPDNFTFGVATASYQIEGAWLKDGKGLSIWDAFTHTPGRIVDQKTGDVACDHYHLFKQDLDLMASMGIRNYRFSISWPRVVPDGRGAPNELGIGFYDRLIDEMLTRDITPWVTLYHWDLPLSLQLEQDGWLDRRIVDAFYRYADVCFRRFGDRVKNWITINEPWVVAMLGYGQGVFAPGRVSRTEPYLAGHNLLLAHAAAVELYRKSYQQAQGGRIGIANNCDWREAASAGQADIDAAQRALEFFLGWFADPVFFGHYPKSMRDRLGSKLPEFTPAETNQLKGSTDFLGLNHYTTMYARHDGAPESAEGSAFGNGGISEDQDVSLFVDPEWEKTAIDWAIVPWGFKKLLHWIDERYENTEIIVTENGAAFDDKFVDGMIHDQNRIAYLHAYMEEALAAIEDGVNLTGYIVWTFIDNFEWASGLTAKLGLVHIDFETLERSPKASADWFSGLVRTRRLPNVPGESS